MQGATTIRDMAITGEEKAIGGDMAPAMHIEKGDKLLSLYDVESNAYEGGMGRVFAD